MAGIEKCFKSLRKIYFGYKHNYKLKNCAINEVFESTFCGPLFIERRVNHKRLR